MRVSLVLTGAVALTGVAHAEPAQVARGPVPSWVTVSAPLAVPADDGGAVFIRRQDIEVHLTGKGQEEYLGYRLKLLQPAALEAGNISLSWKPTAGPPVVHSIRVYRDGQVIDVLKSSSFEILRREEQLEASMISGVLTAILRVPDLRVGDELEVEATTSAADPTLGDKAAGVLALASSPTGGRYHMGLNWDAGHEPVLKLSSDLGTAVTRSGRSIDIRYDNPPVLNPPNDAPARYKWQRVAEYSDFPDWSAMARLFAPLYVKAATLAPASPLRAEAQRIAAANPTPLARASAALKLVQQDVRYVYVGLNNGNLTPTKADETWQRRYGDCKGKTALLLALLAQLGVAAEPVLVNTSGLDDGFDQRLPGPHLFDHVLVRAHIGGKAYWLDGTLPPVAVPSEQPVLPLSYVLPLIASGSTLEHLAWTPPRTPEEIELVDFDARAGFDKPAKITLTSIHRGIKGLQEQVQFSSVGQAQLLAAYRQNAIGDIFQAIDDVRWRYDEKSRASVLTVTGSGTLGWDKDGDTRSLALPGGGFSPPERRVRDSGQNSSAPFFQKSEYECHATTVRLPATTQPKQWSSKPAFDTRMFGRDYHRAWELRDGSIRLIRGSRVEQLEISPAIAQRDNGRIPAFDNSMGYIFYDPAGQQPGVGNGERVPTTDEIDWTAPDVPCTGAAAVASGK